MPGPREVGDGAIRRVTMGCAGKVHSPYNAPFFAGSRSDAKLHTPENVGPGVGRRAARLGPGPPISTCPRESGAPPGNSHALAELTAEKGLSDLPTLREQPDPEGWLANRLRVEFVGDSEVLREFSPSGDRPKDLATIVNQVVNSYMVFVVDSEEDGRWQRLSRLQDLGVSYRYDLNLKRAALWQLRGNSTPWSA